MASRGGELMQKNKQKLNRANEKQQNYRLYKAKKQWITACATVFLTFGASVVVTTSVQADEVVATVNPTETAEVASSSTISVTSSAGPRIESRQSE